MKGIFIPDPKIDKYTNKFLQFIGKQSQLPTFSVDAQRGGFITLLKGARGKHNNLFPEDTLDTTRSNNLSEVHFSFQHIASKSGIRLKRWVEGLTVMLEKNRGKY